MLKAVRAGTLDPVVAPDLGESELDVVRDQAKTGSIVCPLCERKVILKAGEVLICHFAHREALDCPGASTKSEGFGCVQLCTPG
jgi:competence CoiA-like predicted nuclease